MNTSLRDDLLRELLGMVLYHLENKDHEFTIEEERRLNDLCQAIDALGEITTESKRLRPTRLWAGGLLIMRGILQNPESATHPALEDVLTVWREIDQTAAPFPDLAARFRRLKMRIV